MALDSKSDTEAAIPKLEDRTREELIGTIHAQRDQLARLVGRVATLGGEPQPAEIPGSRCEGGCCRCFFLPYSPGELRRAFEAWLGRKDGGDGKWTDDAGESRNQPTDIWIVYPMARHLGEFREDVLPITVNKMAMEKKIEIGHYYTCVHLLPNGDCAINDHKPQVCRDYPRYQNGSSCQYAECKCKPLLPPTPTPRELWEKATAVEIRASGPDGNKWVSARRLWPADPDTGQIPVVLDSEDFVWLDPDDVKKPALERVSEALSRLREVAALKAKPLQREKCRAAMLGMAGIGEDEAKRACACPSCKPARTVKP